MHLQQSHATDVLMLQLAITSVIAYIKIEAHAFIS